MVVLRIRNTREEAKWAEVEAKWEPVILEVLIGSQPASDLTSRVAPDEELYFVNYLLRYTRLLRGEERERLQELALPYLEPIAEHTNLRDTERRARAVQTLGELGLPTHAGAVVKALDDPSPLVAMIAARSLAKTQYAEHSDAVIARLHRFTNWSPYFLSSMLAGIGPDAAPALRRALRDESHPPQLRAVATTALAFLNDVPAADLAAEALKAETDQEFVAAVLRLLLRVGRPEHLPIIRRLATSPNFFVRSCAVSALGSLGTSEDMQILHDAYRDESPWVALHAARALRDAGQFAVLRELGAAKDERAPLALQVLAEVRE